MSEGRSMYRAGVTATVWGPTVAPLGCAPQGEQGTMAQG